MSDKDFFDNTPNEPELDSEQALDAMLQEDWLNGVMEELNIHDGQELPESDWQMEVGEELLSDANSDLPDDPFATRQFDASKDDEFNRFFVDDDRDFYHPIDSEQSEPEQTPNFSYIDQPEPDPIVETPKKKYKKKRTPLPVRLAIYVAAILLIGISLGLFGWECAQDVLALGRAEHEVQVEITKSDSLDNVIEQLYSKGLIHHKWLFELYCKVSHAEEKIDPGVYSLNSVYDYHALVNGMIHSSGIRATTTVMITEGRDCHQIFKLLEENNVCTVAELEEAAANAEFDYWFLENIETKGKLRLEGFLYPDTYEFYISDDAENVLEKILDNYERRVNDDLREEIEASGYTVQQIMTIASLIEKEAAGNADRPDVSAVLHNRLLVEDNYDYDDDYLLLLQMDSTVFYACEMEGLEGFHIDIDNPYNTYKYRGLPPGPIANPGMHSIEAALRPSDKDYYYFATGVDGKNYFFEDHDSFQEFITGPDYVGNAGERDEQ